MTLLAHALHCLITTFPVKYASDFFSCIRCQEKFKSGYRGENS